MTEAEMLDAIQDKVVAWLQDPAMPAEDAMLKIVALYEGNGRELVKADWPAND
jgi:hypothetical protein